jgi:uncharacterized membrane protein
LTAARGSGSVCVMNWLYGPWAVVSAVGAIFVVVVAVVLIGINREEIQAWRQKHRRHGQRS